MSEKIEPVLSAGFNWVDEATLEISGVGYLNLRPEFIARHTSGRGDVSDTPKVTLALLPQFNAALPDSDPRKITRKMVTLLRDIVESERGMASLGERGIALLDLDELERIADALESYLPLET